MITLVTGTMNAGKSKELLATIKVDSRRKLILKPAADTRDGALVKSRALPYMVHAVPVNESAPALEQLILQSIETVEVVYIDEVQMLSPSFLERLIKEAKECEVEIVAAGLTHGYLHEPFDSTSKLIAEADHIKALMCKCDVCKGSIAVFNSRINEDGFIVETGKQSDPAGPEYTYKSVCPSCRDRMRESARVHNAFMAYWDSL